MPDILHPVGLNAKPDKVFAILTTIESLRSWGVRTTTGNVLKGGLIYFGHCDLLAEPAGLGGEGCRTPGTERHQNSRE